MIRERRTRKRVVRGLICPILVVLLTMGCSQPPPMHGHYVGSHSGLIVSVGEDHYHVEVVFVDGEMRFFTLDHDQTQVLAVPEQEVVAYVRSPRKLESVPVKLTSQPQPGDPRGQTSLLAGSLPDEFIGSAVIVTVPSMTIGDKRYRFAFEATAEHGPEMPLKVSDEKERVLYLTAGGAYTESDIAANGKQTASDRYRGFLSEHDFSPQPGDAICPITRTKGNPECTWIIGGQTYQFCCPPCIDEFVKRAKTSPESLQPPEVAK